MSLPDYIGNLSYGTLFYLFSLFVEPAAAVCDVPQNQVQSLPELAEMGPPHFKQNQEPPSCQPVHAFQRQQIARKLLLSMQKHQLVGELLCILPQNHKLRSI